MLIRWVILPFSLFLLLTPTIHPWYLALVFIPVALFLACSGRRYSDQAVDLAVDILYVFRGVHIFVIHWDNHTTCRFGDRPDSGLFAVLGIIHLGGIKKGISDA